MARARIITILAFAVVIVGGLALFAASRISSYEPKLVLPSAAQLANGTPIWVNGTEVGKVSGLEAKDGKAIVTLGMKDSEYIPLHEGTTSRIEWQSALGERYLTLYPGPATNPAIPDGGLIEGQESQIEVDQVLAALDTPTRAKMSSLLQRANATIKGREPDVRSTIQTSGPAVSALGEVLRGIGSDGPALRGLVHQLSEMVRTGAERQTQVSQVVGNLSSLTNTTAAQQEQLAAGLGELPPTLATAKNTLDRVPAVADATVPLLKDLEPSTQRLPSVARNLSPVLTELRPAVAQLRPTLNSANELLQKTPGLLDTANDVLPPLKKTLTGYQPAVSFLRPYAPELAGWISGFGLGFAPYDSQGHYWAGMLAPGTSAFDESPVAPPGAKVVSRPLPGQIVDQPWTDANGSSVR